MPQGIKIDCGLRHSTSCSDVLVLRFYGQGQANELTWLGVITTERITPPSSSLAPGAGTKTGSEG